MQNITNDTSDREISISRLLNAPADLVWEVWTHPEHIKNWWGPDGFTNTIFEMNVAPGGEWHLMMHGPDGRDYENHSTFREIEKNRKIVYEHTSPPHFTATILFEAEGDKTRLHWHMLFDSKEQLIQVVKEYGADEGLKQNIQKLNLYLEAKFKIQNQLKTNHMARVSTYLNFPGNTEEAFNFYKSVFNGKLIGDSMQRFGDIKPEAGMPPFTDEQKKLILHAELEITGGHILMATDAPESMGFNLNAGNNMHIHIEPDSREETERLFSALSEGGNITMALQDMFWGAYYGSCTDKYRINWMFNFIKR